MHRAVKNIKLKNAAIVRCFYYHLDTAIIFVIPDRSYEAVYSRDKGCTKRGDKHCNPIAAHLRSISILKVQVHHNSNFSNIAMFSHLTSPLA